MPTRENLSNLFGYFKALRTCHAKLGYFDLDGQVHLGKGKTGGQQGDPLEMLIFNLTVHHQWGRVLANFQEARAIAYGDDGYIKAKLIVAHQVLAELKHVSSKMLSWSSTSLRPPSSPRASLSPRLLLMWRTTSYNWTFFSLPSVLKVSLVLACLLVLMLWY
jgi:hypothetical protein